MNIDPQNDKSGQIFSEKCSVRPCQSDPFQSPCVDLREVLIIKFHTYLSFSPWLLLHLFQKC